MNRGDGRSGHAAGESSALIDDHICRGGNSACRSDAEGSLINGRCTGVSACACNGGGRPELPRASTSFDDAQGGGRPVRDCADDLVVVGGSPLKGQGDGTGDAARNVAVELQTTGGNGGIVLESIISFEDHRRVNQFRRWAGN